ncbi:hypothetical protein T07_11339 [Trichinella nelsoni]|uniref:Uncharacterized protein n=1 Tax=Trichinella nelsoni TaxID=6336 RepID=A0A0V0RMB3_9BILA|nr:hypothetical protein T07_11339 [Trichinella nelsoni]
MADEMYNFISYSILINNWMSVYSVAVACCNILHLLFHSYTVHMKQPVNHKWRKANDGGKIKFSLDRLVVAHPRFQVDKLSFTILLTAYSLCLLLTENVSAQARYLKPVLGKLFRLKFPTKRCTLLYKLEYINPK